MSDYVIKSSGDEIIMRMEVNRAIIFYGENNKEIGRMFPEDGKLHFEGDADESAKVFFDALARLYKQRSG